MASTMLVWLDLSTGIPPVARMSIPSGNLNRAFFTEKSNTHIAQAYNVASEMG